MTTVYDDIKAERARQEARWGRQDHEAGADPDFRERAETAQIFCDAAAAVGEVTWFEIAEEEFWEAFSETDPVKRRAELVQLAAVIVAAIESEDRRYRGANAP